MSRIADSLAVRRSIPSKVSRRAVTCPGGGTSRRMARPVIDFPEPDSPTIPSFSRPTSKLTPRTASTAATRPGKRTRRSSTVRIGAIPASPDLGVEDVAEPVAEQVEPEAHDKDGDPRHGGHPPLVEEESPSRGDDGAPLRRRRLGPETEEAEPRGGEDDPGHVEAHADDEGRGAERDDVAQQDPEGARALEADRRDDVALANGERLRARDAGVGRPGREGDGDDRVLDARPERRHERERQDQSRKCEEHV